MKESNKPRLKNYCCKDCGGFLTVDFAVSIVVVTAFSVLYFVFCFSLSAAEVAQYIAYSVGRTYAAGHLNEEAQKKLALDKFKKMMSQPGLGKLFQQGWFELTLPSNEIKSGRNGDIFQGYDSHPQGDRLAATGVRLKFKTNLMRVKFGPSGTSNSQDEDLTAFVTGFMVRNPTQDECLDYMSSRTRHRALIELDARYKNYDKSPGSNPDYLPMEDNGC